MNVSDASKRRSYSGSPIPPPLRWTNKIRVMVAIYVNVNFPAFKAIGEKGGNKIAFLRKMRDELQLVCTDKQLKNAFETLMRKYRYLRDKISSFGLQSGETNLQKDLLLQEHPYFEILHEVLGEEPNESSSCTFKGTTFGLVGDGVPVVEMVSSEPDTSVDMTFESEPAVSPNALIKTAEEDFENDDDSDVQPSTSKKFKFKLVRDTELKKTRNLVESTMDVLEVQLKKVAPSDAFTAFAAIVKRNAEHMKEVETNKLQLEKEKFMFNKELADRKMQHKAAKLEAALKTKEMQHNFELEKIKIIGEIDLQKLKLQFELEKLRAPRQP